MKTNLTQGTVWKVILQFTLPLLVGNVLQQCYNLVDSIIVGRYIGKEALAAVSASFFIYYFLIAFIIGIGSGITVVISQCYGAKQYDKVQKAFSSFFIFMLISGMVLSIIGIIFAPQIFTLTHTPKEVLPEAISYFRIYIGGTFLFVTFNSITSILRGLGESVKPMLFIGITTLVNILLDLFFILVLDWGIEGAARATICAYAIGMFITLLYMIKHPILSMKKEDLSFDLKLFTRGIRIGLPTSIQQCAIAIGLVALLSIVNNFGTNTLTAYGIGSKIDAIITQGILTLSSALAAFCGQNIGANRWDRVQKGVRFSLQLNAGISLLSFILIYLWGSLIIGVFTTDQDVIEIGRIYILIISAFMIAHGAMNIYNGALRGAGNTLFAMITSIFSLWIIRIPSAYWFSSMIGSTGIWWAIGISFLIGCIITLIYYKKSNWKQKGKKDTFLLITQK